MKMRDKIHKQMVKLKTKQIKQQNMKPVENIKTK